MKKYILLFLCFFLPACVNAQMKNNKYERLIKKYDIINLLVEKTGKPEVFWQQIESKHNGLLSYKKAISNRKKTAIDAQNEITKPLGIVRNGYSKLYKYDDSDTRNYLRQIAKELLGIYFFRVNINIVEGKEPNAFCTPSGDIYIYNSLLTQIDNNRNMLLGICAHEIAHYYLKHAIMEIWADKKKEKKNNFFAGIAIGLNAAAEIANAGMAGYTGKTYQSNFEKTYNNILSRAHYDNQMFHFKYSREHELEADIIAYRFLEYIGIDPNYYINALSSLGTEGDKFYNDWSDHPTISYRVDFLNYLGRMYPLKP